MPYWHNPQKSSGTVANMVANVIAALLTYQLPTIRRQCRTQFLVILLNDLFFPSPNGVIRLCPLRRSALCSIASTHIWSMSQRISG